MYKVTNNVENTIVFEGNEIEFIDFVKRIAIENEDFDFSVLGASDAKEYIEDYCDNLDLVKTFRIVEWESGKLASFQVYRSWLNAKKDYPSHNIKMYRGNDIEEPTYLD